MNQGDIHNEQPSVFGRDSELLDELLALGLDDDGSEEEPIWPKAFEDGSVDKPGTRIGRYKLLRILGEGGMGIVHLAEQEHPIKRQVALKVIKPGMDTKQVIAHFEAERQVLAFFEHPNIACVHDAGMTQLGRPFFVMEYVEGVPITDYCDVQIVFQRSYHPPEVRCSVQGKWCFAHTPARNVRPGLVDLPGEVLDNVRLAERPLQPPRERALAGPCPTGDPHD